MGTISSFKRRCDCKDSTCWDQQQKQCACGSLSPACAIPRLAAPEDPSERLTLGTSVADCTWSNNLPAQFSLISPLPHAQRPEIKKPRLATPAPRHRSAASAGRAGRAWPLIRPDAGSQVAKASPASCPHPSPAVGFPFRGPPVASFGQGAFGFGLTMNLVPTSSALIEAL